MVSALCVRVTARLLAVDPAKEGPWCRILRSLCVIRRLGETNLIAGRAVPR